MSESKLRDNIIYYWRFIYFFGEITVLIVGFKNKDTNR